MKTETRKCHILIVLTSIFMCVHTGDCAKLFWMFYEHSHFQKLWQNWISVMVHTRTLAGGKIFITFTRMPLTEGNAINWNKNWKETIQALFVITVTVDNVFPSTKWVILFV